VLPPAHFVEVGVDAATAETRVRRMLAVCAAGHILNPKTARSQVIGAMTMGVGAALMEELAVDRRCGFFVNHDLAGYEVPVHADIPHQDVIFLADAGHGLRLPPIDERTNMKRLAATMLSLALVASACAHANRAGATGASATDVQTITIARSGSQPSRQGPAENFTGSVRVEPFFNATAPARASAARVTFERGAHTAWHTHPLGQRLIVTAGVG
jgi:hypothetical protein